MDELQHLLDAIRDRNEQLERAAILRAALPTSAVYNVHLKKGKPRIKPQDFLPSKPQKLTEEQVAQKLMNWAQSFPQGKIEA